MVSDLIKRIREQMLSECDQCTMRNMCDRADNKLITGCFAAALGVLTVLEAALQRDAAQGTALRDASWEHERKPLRKGDRVTVKLFGTVHRLNDDDTLYVELPGREGAPYCLIGSDKHPAGIDAPTHGRAIKVHRNRVEHATCSVGPQGPPGAPIKAGG